MIKVLHGEDTQSSYQKLGQILETFPKHEKVYIDQKTGSESIMAHLFGTSMLEVPKVLVLENFLSSQKKPEYKLFENINPDTQIIFYEKSTLTPAKIKNISKIATIEYFKKEPKVFYFLDSIAPGNRNLLSQVSQLEDEAEANLLWQIENRVLLMLLVKMNLSQTDIYAVTKRHMLDWQLRKIEDQSKKFNTNLLLQIYDATIKIDHMIKSGRTDLNQGTLLKIMFLKYLVR